MSSRLCCPVKKGSSAAEAQERAYIVQDGNVGNLKNKKELQK
jgi:hypothetical protein